MTESLEDSSSPPGPPGIPPGPPDIPPEPPFPTPPKSSGGVGKTVLIAVVAIVVAVAVLFLVPLAFGSNPIDVLRGKTNAQVQEVRTVEERVVQGGQEAVVVAAQKMLPSVVNIEVQISSGFNSGTAIGSGFIYSPDGYIVTNNHVVDGATSIKVSLRDGSTYDGKVVGTDPDTDLGVVKINASDLPQATLGTSADLVVGELAIAVGSPEGFEGSVTSGIISALNRNITVSSTESLYDVIQTDAAINPGNSGGPLCNSLGDVIGINTAIYSQSGGYDGLGFAIPIDSAKPIVEQLISKGSVVHPWLGFTGSTLTPDVAQSYNLPVDKGVLIRRVLANTPAQKAGLQSGDIIVALNGTPIDSMEQFVLELRKYQVGDSVTIDYYRGNDKKQVKATLEEKPQNVSG
jgi:serine protease Do